MTTQKQSPRTAIDAVDASPTEPVWHSGLVARGGAAAYTHLIRAADDPVRSGAERSERRGWNAQDSRRRLNARSVAYHAQLIRRHLADGQARTFNRIAVELYDKTADVVFTTRVNEALWLLVERREIEHTMSAPILFRARMPYALTRGVAGLVINPLVPRWCESGPADERCDLCRLESVPGHNQRLCAYGDCRWSLRVCDACGGFDKARDLLCAHLRECALSLADPDGVWDDDKAQFCSTRQMSLWS